MHPLTTTSMKRHVTGDIKAEVQREGDKAERETSNFRYDMLMHSIYIWY